jgi:hypothetical protein
MKGQVSHLSKMAVDELSKRKKAARQDACLMTLLSQLNV